MVAIKNGKIILENEIVLGKALIFTDKIEGIVEECDIPADASVIDAEGGYVSPGLIELHIHGYLGKDVCDACEESIRIISKGLLENGVTGYLPTTMTVDMEVIKGAIESVRALMAESRSTARPSSAYTQRDPSSPSPRRARRIPDTYSSPTRTSLRLTPTLSG